MTDWRKNAPKRAANATKALELVAKTASKAYDVRPIEAAKMIRGLEDALAAVRSAYAPRLGGIDSGEADPPPSFTRAPATPPAPRPAPLRKAPHILQIGTFVDSLPFEQLPSYLTHIANRLCEAAEAVRRKHVVVDSWSDRLARGGLITPAAHPPEGAPKPPKNGRASK